MSRDTTRTGFHTTRWTLVRQAAGHGTQGRQALSDLCAAYYDPVLAFLRRSGRDEDAARDAAHGFFEAILEKPTLGGAEPGRGHFRSYLLGALKHHLANAHERNTRLKRGGSAEHVALAPGTDTSHGIDPSDPLALPPDREFDRQWALHILHRATESLAAEWAATGHAEEFALLQPFIGGESAHGDLAALAATRGASAATLRKTISRMRQRFRQHMKEELTPTLADGATADDEMRALLEALAP